MKINKIFFLVPVFIILAFSPMKKDVDLIVYNAKIYTVDPEFSIAQSFAVRNGKIVSIGPGKEIRGMYKAKKEINAKGKIIFPGFIDAHCHFYGYGLGLIKKVDLVGTKSFKEVLDRVQKHHKEYPAEWIEGRGWDQNDWKDKEFPDRSELDRLFPDHPVILTRIDGHAVLVNNEALKRAGIDISTTVEGGEIEVENGKLTGILLDNAIDLIVEVMPITDDEIKTIALTKAQENCFAVGLTTIVDAGLYKTTIDLIDALHRDEKLKIRIDAMLSCSDANYSAYLSKGIYKTDRLRVGAIKMFADGALGSRGACLIEPYSDVPDKYGFLIEHPGFYADICEKAYANGFQVNTHAIGDSAVRLILKTYASFLKKHNDLRWRIEHAQVVHPDDFSFFGQYSIIPSIQATHATSDMYWADERLGSERIKGAYAYKQLLDQNGWLPNGTDFPIEDINPLYTFYASVVRKDLEGYPDEGFQVKNALSREEALRSMTIWAAKGSFWEREIGSIERGKNADFVILDKDIMTIPEDEIPRAKVLETYLNGELVYSAY